jgi:hypothetical protein
MRAASRVDTGFAYEITEITENVPDGPSITGTRMHNGIRHLNMSGMPVLGIECTACHRTVHEIAETQTAVGYFTRNSSGRYQCVSCAPGEPDSRACRVCGPYRAVPEEIYNAGNNNVCTDCAYRAVNHLTSPVPAPQFATIRPRPRAERATWGSRITEFARLRAQESADAVAQYLHMPRHSNGTLDSTRKSSKVNGAYIRKDFICGVELEASLNHNVDWSRARRELATQLPYGVGITTDGSVSGFGIELQTPPRSGKEAETVIKKACDALIALNAKVNSTAGLHVHVDASDMNAGDVAHLLASYVVFEDAILSLLPVTRRSNQYCTRLKYQYHLDEIERIRNTIAYIKSPSFEVLHAETLRHLLYSYRSEHNLRVSEVKPAVIRKLSAEAKVSAKEQYVKAQQSFTRTTEEDLKKVAALWYRTKPDGVSSVSSGGHRSHGSRYFGINFHSLFSAGHYEIRFHSGTLNRKKVYAWIALHQGIKQAALKRKPLPLRDLDLCLTRKEQLTVLFRYAELPPELARFYHERAVLFEKEREEITAKVGRVSIK